MRSLIPALIALTFVASPALAQNATSASPGSESPTGSSNGAINGSGNAGSDVNATGTANILAMSALEKGANSFTEAQAKSRIAGAGFTGVSELKKDDQGVWRGTATRGGKQEQVGFDYKGNIGAQ
jgi:hypothetical protein